MRSGQTHRKRVPGRTTPRSVWLPVPEGADLERLTVYYFFDGDGCPAWYPAQDIAGWMVPGSYGVYDIGDETYVRILVHHPGTAQLGLTPAWPAPAGAGFPFAGNGSGMVLLAVTLQALKRLRARRQRS